MKKKRIIDNIYWKIICKLYSNICFLITILGKYQLFIKNFKSLNKKFETNFIN